MSEGEIRRKNNSGTRPIRYTPSAFACSSLLYLQEIGSEQATFSKEDSAFSASYLFLLVASGSGTLEYDGNSFDLSPGDCVFIDCRREYELRIGGAGEGRVSWCCFNSSGMEAIYDAYVACSGRPVFHPEGSSVLPSGFPSPASIFDEIYEIAVDERENVRSIRDVQLNEALSRLLTLVMCEGCRNCEENRDSKDMADSQNRAKGTYISRKRQRCMAVRLYIEEHFGEKITLDNLAGQFHVDKYYLTKCFKEEYGVSINQYIIQMRIQEAKRMLRFTDEKIERIGKECGIGEAAYFSRVFKKMEGISPKEYREG